MRHEEYEMSSATNPGDSPVGKFYKKTTGYHWEIYLNETCHGQAPVTVGDNLHRSRHTDETRAKQQSHEIEQEQTLHGRTSKSYERKASYF